MTTRSAPTLTVQPYSRRFRQAASDLIFRSYRVHSHLDWHEAEDWMEDEQHLVRLAWQGERLVGLMGMSAPLNDACWMRLAVVSDYGDGSQAIRALWENICAELRGQGVTKVAILVSRDWILTYLRTIGFVPTEEIVTLERAKQPILEIAPPEDVLIRLVHPDEVDSLYAVDQVAFSPPWQMERSDLRQAEKISSIGTIALDDGEAVGYALSTVYFDGAHLARLAVAPDQQGRGIATALLSDLLQRFARRSIFTMSVNTQGSNIRSQHVYTRFGFTRNGYDLPVWMYDLL